VVVKWIDLGYVKYIQWDGELVDGNQVFKAEIKRALNYVFNTSMSAVSVS